MGAPFSGYAVAIHAISLGVMRFPLIAPSPSLIVKAASGLASPMSGTVCEAAEPQTIINIPNRMSERFKEVSLLYSSQLSEQPN
jgi:hypothetical protein